MKKALVFSVAGVLAISFFPLLADASSIKGNSLGEISGCDYYLIEDNYGDYTLAEWYGGITPYSGDSVVGELHSYGFKDLYDISMDRSSRAWIDDYMLSEDSAMEKLVDKCGWSSDLRNYFDGGESFYYTPSYSKDTPPAYTTPPAPAITCPANATATGSQCYCNAGYKADGSKCILNASCPTNSHPSFYSYTKDSPADKYTCICNTDYSADSDGECVLAQRQITQRAYDATTYGCHVEPPLTNDEMGECIIYGANPNKFDWQIIANILPETQVSTNQAPSTAIIVPKTETDIPAVVNTSSVPKITSEKVKSHQKVNDLISTTTPIQLATTSQNTPNKTTMSFWERIKAWLKW